jgi:hypothetical protein
LYAFTFACAALALLAQSGVAEAQGREKTGNRVSKPSGQSQNQSARSSHGAGIYIIGAVVLGKKKARGNPNVQPQSRNDAWYVGGDFGRTKGNNPNGTGQQGSCRTGKRGC